MSQVKHNSTNTENEQHIKPKNSKNVKFMDKKTMV